MIIKKCMKCGAMVEVLKDCTCEGCGFKCCGEEMRTFAPNSEDASFEKHLPVVEVVGNEVVVTVPHVMEEDHYIMWIAQVSENRTTRVRLHPGQATETRFPYIPGSVLYEYCNKHGLWKKEVE